MKILERLENRTAGRSDPFLIAPGGSLSFADIAASAEEMEQEMSDVRAGDVVAIIGDFDSRTIGTMLRLLDRNAIVMPLTEGARADHEYFFDAGEVQWVIRGNSVERRPSPGRRTNGLLAELRAREHPGVIFFSSGTTGRPKAILHDFTNFLARYSARRSPLRALNFLLFDHAGGINTMLHTLLNGGVVVVPSGRTVDAIASDMLAHQVELLPATPTFLRMMLLDGIFDTIEFPDLRMITYGTERMDQGTLDRLCAKLPQVDFRQTYGLSELGVLQVRSRARDSLWMQIGGDGVETRIVNSILHIRSENRMLGYLNAPDPFSDGWYDTGDIVETDGDFVRITGRASEVLNVGGLKILPGEVERVALLYPGILRAKAYGAPNPITGQHVEITVEPADGRDIDRRRLGVHFREHLQKQFCPSRVVIGAVPVSHRFKQK